MNICWPVIKFFIRTIRLLAGGKTKGLHIAFPVPDFVTGFEAA